MACIDQTRSDCTASTVAVEPLTVMADAPLLADPFVVLFCALFASVCGMWVATRLAGANVDDGGAE